MLHFCRSGQSLQEVQNMRLSRAYGTEPQTTYLLLRTRAIQLLFLCAKSIIPYLVRDMQIEPGGENQRKQKKLDPRYLWGNAVLKSLFT